MGTTKTNTATTLRGRGAPAAEPKTAFGRRMRKARIDAGLSLDETMQRVTEALGRGSAYPRTREFLRALELDKDGDSEDRIDPVMLVVLGEIYDVAPHKLSPNRRADVDRLAALFERALR